LTTFRKKKNNFGEEQAAHISSDWGKGIRCTLFAEKKTKTHIVKEEN